MDRNETPVLVVFAVATLLAVGVVLWRAERDALHDPVKKGERGELVGEQGQSLVRAPNFARALQEIRRRLGPEDVIDLVRLSPVRVSARVHDEQGEQRFLDVDAGFDVDERDFGQSSAPGFRPEAVDPAAPQRFFAAVRRRTGAGARSLDYLVLSLSGAERGQGWTLFLVDVRIPDKQWQADAHGRDPRRLGAPA